MGKVVKFRAQGKEYPLSIIDREGRRWVTAQQVGEALGNKNIRDLINELLANGEIQEGKHLSRITLLNSGPGNPRRILLSWRGVIRVMMRSQGQRAREFRDWAETVLYQVMTTGRYHSDRLMPAPVEEIRARARAEGIRQGLALSQVMAGLDREIVSKLVHLRRLGLTQREVGAITGLNRGRVQYIERKLRQAGVVFQAVNRNKRDKAIREKLVENILSLPGACPSLPEGGAL